MHVPAGGSDSFSYSLPWLGQLQRLAVWHDNSGAAGGRGPWHLEAVEVSSSREQQVRRKAAQEGFLGNLTPLKACCAEV